MILSSISFSNNLLTTFALAFPGSLYLFRKEIGLVGINLLSTLFARHVVLYINLKIAIKPSVAIRFQINAPSFVFQTIGKGACVNNEVLCC